MQAKANHAKTPAINTAAAETLNDLVLINNDRIQGYVKALEETSKDDKDVRAIFTKMIEESRKIRMDLAGEVEALGGEIEQGTTTSGKLYRAWMDVKAVFTGHSKHAVLSNCERGEDAAQQAYKDALAEESLPGYIRTTLQAQQSMLKASHDEIKALRDASK